MFIAKTSAANMRRSSATKRRCKEGVSIRDIFFIELTQDRQSKRSWVITSVKHGPTGELAEPWRLWPSAGRPIGRPLRCGVFDIVKFAIWGVTFKRLCD